MAPESTHIYDIIGKKRLAHVGTPTDERKADTSVFVLIIRLLCSYNINYV